MSASDRVQQIVQQAGHRQLVLNGKTYSVKLLPATKGMSVSARIIKAVGPAFGVLLDSSNEDLFPEEISMFTDLAVAVVRQLDELQMEITIKELLGGLSCDGQSVNFDEHFAGNYGELIAVTEYALKENFGDFFTEYLKAKGLEIHTLREMFQKNKEEKPEELED